MGVLLLGEVVPEMSEDLVRKWDICSRRENENKDLDTRNFTVGLAAIRQILQRIKGMGGRTGLATSFAGPNAKLQGSLFKKYSHFPGGDSRTVEKQRTLLSQRPCVTAQGTCPCSRMMGGARGKLGIWRRAENQELRFSSFVVWVLARFWCHQQKKRLCKGDWPGIREKWLVYVFTSSV